MQAQSHTLPSAILMYNKYNTAVCLHLQLRIDGSRGTVGASWSCRPKACHRIKKPQSRRISVSRACKTLKKWFHWNSVDLKNCYISWYKNHQSPPQSSHAHAHTQSVSFCLSLSRCRGSLSLSLSLPPSEMMMRVVRVCVCARVYVCLRCVCVCTSVCELFVCIFYV